MMRLTGTFLSLALVTPFLGMAQQDPIYAQYLNNPMTINPAYAGSNKMFNAGIQYRSQWAGIEANPTTFNFNSHMAVLQNKVGLGIQAIQDKIGDNKNTEFNTLYSYRIQLKSAQLSFGMQAGFVRYTNNPSSLTILDKGDPAFNSFTEMKFNTGAGLLLKNDRFMVGVSVPRLLPTAISQGGQPIQLYSQNYYFFGSYGMLLSDKLRFKPSVLLRGTKGSPLSADVNTSFNYKELYTAGLFTRNFKTYGVLMQLLLKSYRLGYVFEFPGNESSSLRFVSHEVTLGISMGVLTYHDRATKTF